MEIPAHEKPLNTVGNMRLGWIRGLLLDSLSALSLNATTIDLGSASGYSVLAGSMVTNTGPTVVSGDLGVSQGSVHHGISSRNRERDAARGGRERFGRSA